MEFGDWVYSSGLVLVLVFVIVLGIGVGLGLGLDIGVLDGSLLPYIDRSNDIAFIHTFLSR